MNPGRLIAAHALLATLQPLPVPAQEPAQAPVPNIFREVEEVNLVNIDVVVRDRSGKPIHDLPRDAFELFENGVPVELSNFYAVRNGQPLGLEVVPPANEAGGTGHGAAAAEAAAHIEPAAPPTHLVIYIDDANLAPLGRRRVLEDLRAHLDANWQSGVEAMLVRRKGTATIEHSPTADKAALLSAIDHALQSPSAVSRRLEMERAEIMRAMARINVNAGSGLFGPTPPAIPNTVGQNPEDIPDEMFRTGFIEREKLMGDIASQALALQPLIRTYAEARRNQILAATTELGTLIDSLAGLPGRKALLYVSDGLSMSPARGVTEAFQRRFQILPRVVAEFNGPLFADDYDLSPEFDKLAERANRNRVTIYAVDASSPSGSEQGAAAGTDTIGGNLGTGNTSIERIEEFGEQESLQQLAGSTGGQVALNPAALGDALTSFLDDFRSYYSLGYVAERLDPTRERSIEVRVRDLPTRAEIRYRRTIRDRTADERLVERTMSTLLLAQADQEAPNPLAIALETQEPIADSDGRGYVVPVLVRVPLANLVLTPGPATHDATLAMFVAVRDQEGRTSRVVKHVCPIRIPNDQLLTALGQEGRCGVRLRMRSGRQTVAVAVRDEAAAVDSASSLRVEVGKRAGLDDEAAGATDVDAG